MTCTAKKAIEIARQYIGYHEGYNNDVPWLEKIFEDYPQMDDDALWCDKFFDGVIVIACEYDYKKAQYVLCGNFDDYTPISAGYYQDAGRYGENPETGAQIFFRNGNEICHTGIVTGFDDETVYTIEGNANDEVEARSYDRDNWRIAGYGYPRYDEETDYESEDEMNKQALIKPDGMNYMIWFDGENFHDLDNPDEMKAIQMFYEQVTGKEIPTFEFGSETAPWFHRLQDAMKHGHNYGEHM